MKKHISTIAAIAFVLALFLTACSLKAQTAGVSLALAISSPQRAANSIVAAKRYVYATGNAYYNCMDGRFYPVFRSKFGGWDFYMKYDRAKGKRVRQYLNPWL